MSMSWTRVRAISRKEIREYRRNGAIVSTMTLIPLVFALPPLVHVLGLTATASRGIGNLMLYVMGVPALVPASVAAYSVVGERQHGTLEPVLTTPVRRGEFLLGKVLAALVPALAVSCGVYAFVLVCGELLARPAVASAFIRGPDLLALLLFTVPLIGWSLWVGIAISARASDFRVAQQLSTVAGLPPVVMTSLVAFGVIHASLGVALGLGATLVAADGIGCVIMSAMFDRERLVLGVKS